jgi:xylan 1,4-beta-xylosidase
MSENYVFPLSDDGMHLIGPGKKVLNDEIFPDDWEIQGIYTEGPRLLVKDGWIYLLIAAGGTEGPPTAHAIFSYRAKNVLGPWDRSPYNPILRTYSRHEKWINKGHGILVEDLNGSWYIMYHGLMKERENQGMMLLMEPIEWTKEGWFRIPEWSSPDKLLPAPKGGKAVLHGYPTTIHFPRENPVPGEWIYYGDIKERMENTSTGLVMTGRGTSLHDSPGVLCYSSVFKNFEVVVEVTAGNGAGAGIAMYYSALHSVGFALKDGFTWVFNCNHFNLTRRYNGKQYLWDHVFLKLTVRNQIVSLWFSPYGNEWTKLPSSFNILHINFQACIPRVSSSLYSAIELLGTTMYPALFVYGNGKATFHQFWIKELEIED